MPPNNNLDAYFETNFALMQHHKYNITEIENMIPQERDIYVDMLINYIKEENDKRKREYKRR